MFIIQLAILILAVLGAPLFIVIGVSACLGFINVGGDPAILFTDFFRISSAPAMVAIPFFIFAGYLLAESKAPQRIIAFSEAILCWMPGGLPFVALISCAIFTAFTGASAITIVAVGSILYPALVQEGYKENFSLGLVTIGGGLGILFVPCLPLILYGVVSQTNIEDLFIAGIIPGVTLIALNFIYTSFIGLKYSKTKKFSFSQLKLAFMDIIWELPLPVLILSGIFGGWFSASEAASIAVVYLLVVEVLINKDVKISDIKMIVRESMKMTGAIILIVGMALGLTDFFIDQRIPQQIFEVIHCHIHSKITFLLLLNVFLVVVGCLMDIFSACVVIVPIILPISKLYGIDPVHLGIIFLTNLELGFITPPVGISLFISSLKFNKSYIKVVKSIVPFFIINVIGLLLVTYLPKLSLILLELTSRKGLIVL